MSSGLWRREGLIVSVQSGHRWWASHAQLPTVLPLSDRLWRVYFAARDAGNRSRSMAVDLDPGDNMRIVAEHFNAVLDRGPPGSFDHEGALPSCAVVVGDHVRLYYIGIVVRADVRGQGAIGLAVSDDGLNFRRAFDGPMLGTGPFDPFFSVAPIVRRAPDGYRMWYVGGTSWRSVDGALDPFYEIRRSYSADGLIWDQRTQSAYALEPPWAGLARPWVTETARGLKLWFSRRGAAYRAGGDSPYRLLSIEAEEDGSFSGSASPVRFENPPRPGDFDSWMQAYSCVLPYGDDLIMFYNGDDFGRAGFGWARLPGGARNNGGFDP